eukprot:CAMPEP_0174755482 /NCGR_PEP_ID=MMETSP1094-20130205/106266_1 /TAXON_ID=156173 /ORGANISM="Chrysochromulina brevifilum, Strain UTEX LB 985" /LENGTH=112 /DNA_ID=CAMNT_0015961371 /DNA_START=688 /DNA_END=1026 /DNA_ORIENTATION=+
MTHVRGQKGAREGEGAQRPLRAFEGGPDGSSSGRPAGDSNPIAWPKPEARYGLRASFQIHARIDSRHPIAWPKPEARYGLRASFQIHARIDSRQQQQQGRCAALKHFARART